MIARLSQLPANSADLRLAELLTASLLCTMPLATVTAEPVPQVSHFVTAEVRTPNGSPVANLPVVFSFRGADKQVVLKGINVQGGIRRLQTDAQGRFTLDCNGTNLALMAASAEGFCLAQSRDLTNGSILVLQPWARVEGTRTVHNRPLPRHRLALNTIGRCIDKSIEGCVAMDAQTTTDAEGRFVFEHVPPVEVLLKDVLPWQGANARRGPHYEVVREVDMEPGETRRVNAATRGRTVVGRIELGGGLAGMFDLKSLDHGFQRGLAPEGLSKFDVARIPAAFDTPDKRAKWLLDWLESTEAGRWRKARFTRGRDVMIRADGTFVCEMVEPGNYVLDGQFYKDGRRAATIDSFRVVVPPAKPGEEDTPVDAGTARLEAFVWLKPGDAAPEFTAPMLEGPQMKLSEFRGKYVLLDFWATWCGPCVAEMPHLKTTYDTFGKDLRFTIVSLSCDSDHEAPRTFAKAKGIAWPQAFSDDLLNKSYGVMSIPQIMLVGPEGRLVARDLRGPAIKAAVAAALAK